MRGATRLDGMIQGITMVVDGTMNGAVFLSYVQQCLVPSLRPGDVASWTTWPVNR